MSSPEERRADLERARGVLVELRELPDVADRAFAVSLNAALSDMGTTDGALAAAIATGQRIIAAAGRRAEDERARRWKKAFRRERAQVAAEAKLHRVGGSVLALQVVHAVRKTAPAPISIVGPEDAAFEETLDALRKQIRGAIKADVTRHVLEGIREDAERRQVEGEARRLEEKRRAAEQDDAWYELRRRHRRRRH